MAAAKSPDHKRARAAGEPEQADAMMPQIANGPRKVVALPNQELTQAFLAHEDQLAVSHAANAAGSGIQAAKGGWPNH